MGELSGGFFFELDAQAPRRGAEARAVGRLGPPRRHHRADARVAGGAARWPPRRARGHRLRERHGEHSRIHQFALAYLFDGSTEVYTCPLAMTDGAAKTLRVHGNQALVDRALPRLLSRDPAGAGRAGSG